ncbi:hypothetical protein SAMN05216535_0409 [Stutzerimonas xanthomarina]|uniref:Uncharacterized protein n=2 Tax=Stutzerimonas xanthomarina TaxID=271420 RepID=A0A1M5TFN1_9GAMM|nr:hypothetical protein SAMN05216535_0409 [Stutzerimonas xanthomarina]SHH49488.1 hypothetical protein SAMN02744645_3871 [Stutzerimonas xanthomarina DSM 18231]
MAAGWAFVGAGSTASTVGWALAHRYAHPLWWAEAHPTWLQRHLKRPRPTPSDHELATTGIRGQDRSHGWAMVAGRALVGAVSTASTVGWALAHRYAHPLWWAEAHPTWLQRHPKRPRPTPSDHELAYSRHSRSRPLPRVADGGGLGFCGSGLDRKHRRVGFSPPVRSPPLVG